MHFYLRKTVIAILAVTLWNNILSSSSPNAPYQAPSGWRKIDAEGKFNFYLPPNMWDTGVHGIENLHHEYTNGRLHLSYDYEPYGVLAYDRRARAFGKDFQETELQIDGRKAFLFVHQDFDMKKRRTYNADLFVGDFPNGEVILHMWTMSWSPRYVETAKTIFQTIKFSSSQRH